MRRECRAHCYHAIIMQSEMDVATGITDYQSKYFAHELTRRAPAGSVDRLSSAVAGATVDLNPHQVEAALFAYKSPLSKGALLADEVGLGKTIEAGLVLSQHWAERKRRLLVITPANLRKQWFSELEEKFYLPCQILETRSYNEAQRQGNWEPFDTRDAISICSYQFARSKASDIFRIPWDLVVIDEAHRLRNVWKGNAKIAGTIKEILASRRKLLLTATPLQNSLLELYGLVSIIDDHVFGDVESFREQFMRPDRAADYRPLKERLEPICIRTLRRQVTAYVSYTKRLPMLEEFTPEEAEDQLYDLVTEYLQRPNLKALPKGQRTLMTLVLRKLLASSTFAIAGALETMANRLERSLGPQKPARSLDDELGDDYEALDETAEEWDEEPIESDLSADERRAIEAEVKELRAFAELAGSITNNAKGEALLQALGTAMEAAVNLGAERKAIIFTESRKTQLYLQRILDDTTWRNGVVLFNGTNNDEKSRAILKRWLERHAGTDRVTGSKTADMRSALVDYFREEGQVMIATEAAAEGINLQFCSLVVNYDLPWNPQRIEQRIGRCHRYGQKHDVVVVNFVNRKNEADKRVYELLSEKFKLFDGVFGASDEVLGALESGVEFERRIAAIYQSARKTEEIEAAFTQLQLELSPEIDARMQKTRQQILENLDAEVADKLRIQSEASKKTLDRTERLLMQVTAHELGDYATVEEEAFDLMISPIGIAAPLGRYELPRRSPNAHIYRLGHPLAEYILNEAMHRELPPAEVAFHLSGLRPRISALEPYIGRRGILAADLLTIESLDEAQDFLVLTAQTDTGEQFDEEMARRLLSLPADAKSSGGMYADATIANERERKVAAIARGVRDRSLVYFAAESEKLDNWSDDQKVGLEREIKDLDRRIREVRKSAKQALTLEDKLAGQKAIRMLESERLEKRKQLFVAQDEIDSRRDQLIAEIEARLEQQSTVTPLFVIQWAID